MALTERQLRRLHEAAKCSWADVEPAIFGTLIERALDPKERHALGAHYTPRAYVERLVRPTIEEPLREEWENVQAQVRLLHDADKLEGARKAVRAFLTRLGGTKILDPACGSGNFLYVALDLLKRIEGEAIQLLDDLGEKLLPINQFVTPAQFLGIEKNPWRRGRRLVLDRYLQWHFRTWKQSACPTDLRTTTTSSAATPCSPTTRR